MATDTAGSGKTTERWDQLYEALASQPRRTIIFSLLKAPEDQWLSLPDAADSPMQPMDSQEPRIELRHHHLPKLADAGYVRWESDPFRVRRGPHFEEPGFVVSRMIEADEKYPERLREECVVIGGATNDSN
ncbi:hypothetical protein [Halobellus limi]|uniref:ArsR family transcriptional regulator n=1 Tax=Halobellus limi TaxID=699433 RepID=A0A1H5TNN6_9EURY|nr:hypothetical protein [Halobellus limi]QCC47268.1 hypothetical protein DV707_06060 [Halobellus limi]SEF64425.1 hypothetical protein SAMN04488133_0336 [Halobellus limi]